MYSWRWAWLSVVNRFVNGSESRKPKSTWTPRPATRSSCSNSARLRSSRSAVDSSRPAVDSSRPALDSSRPPPAGAASVAPRPALRSAAPVSLGIRCPKFHAKTGPVLVGSQHSAARIERAFEEHPLDPLMVVEVLHVTEIRDRGRYLRVQVRRAVRRHLSAVRSCQRGSAQEFGDPAAPGQVQLQAVNRAGVDEAGRAG